MKVNYKRLALFTVLSLMAVSCQKETIMEQNIPVQQTMSVRVVSYTIDGVTQRITIRGEQSWREFVNTLFALTKQGHSVSFKNETAQMVSNLTKDVVTYETDDEKKAKHWCAVMTDEGYTVCMSYDEETGKYTCIAVR